jgi:hypothetical protein
LSDDPEIEKIKQRKLEEMIRQNSQPQIQPGIIDLNDMNPMFIMFKSGQIVDKMMGAVGAPGIHMICKKHSD